MNIAQSSARAAMQHSTASARARRIAASNEGAPDFRGLLTAAPKTSQTGASSAGVQQLDGTAVPTAEAVFGANPWNTSATGSTPYGSQYGFNPFYFATDPTAQKVAQMLGGRVVQQNAILGDNGLYTQQVKNNMVELPNGRVVNAGLIASFFTHGYSSNYIESMLQRERDTPATV